MTRLKKPLITALVALLCLSVIGVVFAFSGIKKANADTNEPTIYLDYGASWKYNCGYVDDYYTVDTVGASVVSDAWAEGKAPFGFSKYGQYDLSGGTEVSDKNQIHYVFTTKFTVDTLPNALSFGLYYDDAIALYLNGVEIYRDNVKGINFTKLSSTDKVIETVGTASEVIFNVVTDKVKTGENVLTAIIVEDYKGGNDAYLNVKVSGITDFEVDSTDMPDTVALTYYDDPFTSRGVTFYTGYALNTADARYRKLGDTEWNYVKSNVDLLDDTEIWYGEVSHKVAFIDLEENSTYEYSLGSKVLDQWGKTYTFDTTSAEKSLESFKFYYMTDSQSSNSWQFSIWQQLAAYIEANGETFDFFAHGGDIVESSVSAENLVPEQWSQGFNALESTMTNLPVVPVAGNHEYSAYAFYKHFNIKYASFNDSGAYYSFDYGNAHFTVLNTNDSYHGRFDDQLAWVENDLSTATKPWKIVLMHFSAVTDTAEGTGEYNNVVKPVQEKLMPVYSKYGVDLVLSGHTHRYFRSAVYGHSENLKGADTAETMQNIRNSARTDVITYTDSVDGTIWTVDPKGTMYVTAKSANYNVYYQNLSWNQNTSAPLVFATNPLNGKVMNGGTKEDDTSYLMNYMQYVSVEVTEETLRCNVYNVKADTGETTLWDTYNVIKADSTKLNSMIENLPTVDDLKASDFENLVKAYGLYGALGNNGITPSNVTKIEQLELAVDEQEAVKIMDLNARIAQLTVNDVDAFVDCQEEYDELDADLKKYVDTTNMDQLRPLIESQIKETTDKRAAGEVTDALNKADAIALLKLTQDDVTGVKNKYDALTADQKALVKNAEIIDNLQAKLGAAEVVKQIEALKTAPKKMETEQAYNSYNALSAKEKTYVENYDILVAIKERLEENGDEEGDNMGLVIGLSAGGATVTAGAAAAIILLRKKKLGVI